MTSGSLALSSVSFTRPNFFHTAQNKNFYLDCYVVVVTTDVTGLLSLPFLFHHLLRWEPQTHRGVPSQGYSHLDICMPNPFSSKQASNGRPECVKEKTA